VATAARLLSPRERTKRRLRTLNDLNRHQADSFEQSYQKNSPLIDPNLLLNNAILAAGHLFDALTERIPVLIVAMSLIMLSFGRRRKHECGIICIVLFKPNLTNVSTIAGTFAIETHLLPQAGMTRIRDPGEIRQRKRRTPFS